MNDTIYNDSDRSDAMALSKKYIKESVDWITLSWAGLGLIIIATSTWAGFEGHIYLWLAYLINVYFMFFIFAPMHEASHKNIGHGKSDWLNSFVGWLCGAINLVPYRGWGDLHAWHHSYVNNEELDPDAKVGGKNPFVVIFRALTVPANYLHFYITRGVYGKIKGGVLAFAWIIMTWVIAIGISGLVWAYSGNYKLMVLWPLAGFMNIFIMDMMFVWFPHYPRAGNGRKDNSTTYVFPGYISPFFRLIDIWQSYHLVHHAFPRVPFYSQGKLFKDIRSSIEKDGSIIIDIGR